MIFVTVGTHEQPFNRLIECVDNLVKEGRITEEVIVQIGYSNYEPKYCKFFKLIAYQDMVNYVNDARIVITHGGPASFIMPLQVGKIPIVVPRQKKYNEHVNDHQVEFCNEVEKRNKNIIVVEDINLLCKAIDNYEEVLIGLNNSSNNNNDAFNEKFKNIINDLFSNKN